MGENNVCYHPILQVRAVALVPVYAVEQSGDNNCQKNVEDDINYFDPIPFDETSKEVMVFHLRRIIHIFVSFDLDFLLKTIIYHYRNHLKQDWGQNLII